jgi:hypothetical protein
MVIVTSGRNTLLGRIARLGVLVPVSAFIAHDAIFGSDGRIGGVGSNSAAAPGHSYWTVFALVVAVLVVTFVGRAIRHIRTLQRTVGGRASEGLADGEGPGYHRELLSVWAALFPLTCLFFTIQENLEGLADGVGVVGLGPIDGTSHSNAIPLLALASLTVAAVGAFIQWRTRRLEARLARLVAGQPRPRPRNVVPSPAWRLIAAACQHTWIVLRPDPGRAPPLA